MKGLGGLGLSKLSVEVEGVVVGEVGVEEEVRIKSLLS